MAFGNAPVALWPGNFVEARTEDPDPVLTSAISSVFASVTARADSSLLNAIAVGWLPGSVADNLISNSLAGLEGHGGGTVTPQLLVWAKSPVALTPVMFSAALPVLLSVTLCGKLVDPTGVPVKVSVAGERTTTGPSCPVPERVMS